MMSRYFEFRSITATFGVVVPFAALIWLFAVPQTMSVVTLVALTLVTLGAALVAFNTWRNGQATRNIGHVLERRRSGRRVAGAQTRLTSRS